MVVTECNGVWVYVIFLSVYFFSGSCRNVSWIPPATKRRGGTVKP